MDPRNRVTAILAALVGATTVAVAVLYGIGGFAVHAEPPPAVLDKLEPAAKLVAVPDLSFTDGAGKSVKLANFRGKVLVLNLWATWCGPCITELPALARAKAVLPADRFTVVTVDSLEKQPPEKIASFFAAHHAEGLPIYSDSSMELTRAFVAYALPLTLLIDARGNEIARAVGDQKWDDPAALAYLRRLAK